VNVIVDTSIWSLALRRQKPKELDEIKKLTQLIEDHRVIMLGSIRQELLSGIKSNDSFILLKDYLRAFQDFPITTNDYEIASQYFNKCRKKGIQGSNTDFLICAVASNNSFKIFTNDNDFVQFKKFLPIELY